VVAALPTNALGKGSTNQGQESYGGDELHWTGSVLSSALFTTAPTGVGVYCGLM
jgi:hypothetical protein